MLKKELQIIENEKVLKALETFKNTEKKGFSSERLYNCSAIVIDNENGYKVLQSYNTIIAVMLDGVVYDFLRLVYGYTATSAQHISKFAKKYGASEVLHYKEI